jgi:hypothetical protein
MEHEEVEHKKQADKKTLGLITKVQYHLKVMKK